jgi:hypothetical protein
MRSFGLQRAMSLGINFIFLDDTTSSSERSAAERRRQ